MLNFRGLRGFVNGRSFLETNLTGWWLKVVLVEKFDKFESESPLLASKNETGGGVW